MNMLGRSVHWCNLQGHSPERIASGQIGANVAGCVALFSSSSSSFFLLLCSLILWVLDTKKV